jgi:ClpP class serine protease
VWLGAEALALGLIDGLGDVRSVCRAEFGDDVKLVKVDVGPAVPWPLRAFQTALGAAMGLGDTDGKKSLTENLADSMVGVIDERAAWVRYKAH